MHRLLRRIVQAFRCRRKRPDRNSRAIDQAVLYDVYKILSEYFPWLPMELSFIGSHMVLKIFLEELQKLRWCNDYYDLGVDIKGIPEEIHICVYQYEGERYFGVDYILEDELYGAMIPSIEKIDPHDPYGNTMHLLLAKTQLADMCGPNMMYTAHNTWLALYFYMYGLYQNGWIMRINRHFDITMQPSSGDSRTRIEFIPETATAESYIIWVKDGESSYITDWESAPRINPGEQRNPNSALVRMLDIVTSAVKSNKG